jgi:hypothetical protein
MKKPRFGAFFVKLVMQSLSKHDCHCYLRVTDYSACGLVNRWGRIPPSKARAIRPDFLMPHLRLQAELGLAVALKNPHYRVGFGWWSG